MGGAYVGVNSGPKAIEVAAVEQSSKEKIKPQVSPSPVPTTAEIVEEIARVFEGEGKHVVVKAINCFYSESGLRAEAVSKPNTNGTIDAGVAQINDIHKMSIKERLDFRKNIKKAYQIYKGRGSNFNAWYGKLCNT